MRRDIVHPEVHHVFQRRAKADGRNRTVRDEDGSKRAVVTPINAESDRRREARG